VIDPTAFVALDVASRVMAEQFSEEQRPARRSSKPSPTRSVRSQAARALRSFADALDPTPERPQPA
jgi:hypothetical protein